MKKTQEMKCLREKRSKSEKWKEQQGGVNAVGKREQDQDSIIGRKAVREIKWLRNHLSAMSWIFTGKSSRKPRQGLRNEANTHFTSFYSFSINYYIK